ncbi:MAG: hypothetical protein V3V08_03545 [Nannocystaceae bacterium]
MFIVSGTKRSGTSMWMQVMAAAGLPILGEAFPRNWKTTLATANPDGFYESILRQGVYWRTNPHPRTGNYFMPKDVDGYAVKVFVPGVIRTERAYISRLLANVREWREYEASIQRLYAMEDEQRKKRHPDAPTPYRFPPAYEWWMENFALVRDITLRRYPARLMSYDRVLRDPEREVTATLQWLGTGDLKRAIAAVKPHNRTQVHPRSSAVPSDLAELFDELYATIDRSDPVNKSLLQQLNQTNKRLLPLITDMQTKVAQQALRRRPKGRVPDVSGLPGGEPTT